MTKHIHIHLAPTRKTKDAKFDVFRARVNLQNFSNPEWVKKGGWPKDKVDQVIRESKAIIASNGKTDQPTSKDAQPMTQTARQGAAVLRLANRFKVSLEDAKKELIAEGWDEESAAINLRAMKKTSDAARRTFTDYHQWESYAESKYRSAGLKIKEKADSEEAWVDDDLVGVFDEYEMKGWVE